MVCTGNICRSPVAEMRLRQLLPEVAVRSAGLGALAGHDIDPETARAARDAGVALTPHSARQFDESIGRAASLILVMEDHHRAQIMEGWPPFLGKTFLLGQFENAKQIPDPYRRESAVHRHAVAEILRSLEYWKTEIAAMLG